MINLPLWEQKLSHITETLSKELNVVPTDMEQQLQQQGWVARVLNMVSRQR